MRGARIQVSALLYLFCTGNGRGCAQLVYRETIAEALVATGISSWADTRPWFKNLWLGATCFPSGSERDALVLGARFLGIPSPSRTTAGILLYLQIFGREEHLEVFSELASSLWGSAGTPQKTNVTTTYSFVFFLCLVGNSGCLRPLGSWTRTAGATREQPPTCLLGDFTPGEV